jgi:hypothetical protein
VAQQCELTNRVLPERAVEVVSPGPPEQEEHCSAPAQTLRRASEESQEFPRTRPHLRHVRIEYRPVLSNQDLYYQSQYLAEDPRDILAFVRNAELLDLQLSHNLAQHTRAEQSVRHKVLGTLALELLVSVCRKLPVLAPADCIQVYKHEVLAAGMPPEVIDGIS